MFDLNNADKQVEFSEEEHHKIEMELLIEDAVHLITNKTPTNREDLEQVALRAHYAGVEVPWEVIARIKGGMPAKKAGGPPVKVSNIYGHGDREKWYLENNFCIRYHGHKRRNIKPAHIEIRNREVRLKAIAQDLRMPKQCLKSFEALLTRWHKENPDYKENSFI